MPDRAKLGGGSNSDGPAAKLAAGIKGTMSWQDAMHYQLISEHLNRMFPHNSGIFIYGSVLFRPVARINDIDVVVITDFAERKRLVEIVESTEMHINLVSKDVFEDDLSQRKYGEYYVSKIMNPHKVIRDSTSLRMLFCRTKSAKLREALVLAGQLCQEFDPKDAAKLVTWLRILQFPHYMSSAVMTFANLRSDVVVEFLNDYATALQQLARERFLHENSGRFVLATMPQRDERANMWSRYMSTVPLYWRTFEELHGGGADVIAAYAQRHTLTLIDLLTTHLSGVAELKTSCFLNAFLSRIQAT
jgi:hypothetical protein